jgi:hypothetical protein
LDSLAANGDISLLLGFLIAVRLNLPERRDLAAAGTEEDQDDRQVEPEPRRLTDEYQPGRDRAATARNRPGRATYADHRVTDTPWSARTCRPGGVDHAM